jgi:hypothetical protein
MKQVGSVKIDDALLEKAMGAKAEGQTYTGAGDNMVDFGAARSFMNEDDSAKRVNIVLKNASQADVDIQFNDIIENVASANILKEGTIITDVTAKGSPRSCDVLAKYVHVCPIRIRAIKLNAKYATQLDYPLRYRTENPFTKNAVEVERIPSNYQSQDTNNPNMVEVKDITGWQLSDLSTILYTVGAGQEVTVTILFGAALDTAGALGKKAEDAALTVAQAYLHAQGA